MTKTTTHTLGGALGGTLGTAAAALLLAGPASAAGVTKTEILLGTHTALTGPVAPWGTGSVNGIRLRLEEENAKGGINGPQAQADRRGQRLPGSACGPGGQQAAQPRQDLRHDGRARHTDEQRRSETPAPQGRDELRAVHRRAVDGRAVPQAQVHGVHDLLRADPRRHQTLRREARAARRSASCIRTPTSAGRS